MPNKETIVEKVKRHYPGLDPEKVLLDLYIKYESCYKAAAALPFPCSPSGFWRVVRDIEYRKMVNGNGK